MSGKGSSAAHTALVHAILAELGALPGVVIGINASGRAAYFDEKTGRTRRVPYGWPVGAGGGSPDILAAVAPLGRLVALEAKTGSAVLSAEQRACHEALRAVGVAVHVVRSVEEARAALARLSPDAEGSSPNQRIGPRGAREELDMPKQSLHDEVRAAGA